MSERVHLKHRPAGLIILDGWGHRTETKHNAIAAAHTPNWDKLLQEYPNTLINTSGMFVGLPNGQMGNSEVGHMNLGAGRVVYQELARIQKDIDDGRFFNNNALLKAIDTALDRERKVHIMGLLSDGGVHSHIEHIKASIKLAHERGAEVYFHAFTDGRDTPPQSALEYIKELENFMTELGGGKIVSVTGRYYAMDRDKRWERTSIAYDVVACGISEYEYESATEAVKAAYARGENDEFIKPTHIAREDGKKTRVKDGDSIIFMNFRADRARQITQAFIFDGFEEFHRCKRPILSAFVTLTEYKKNFEKFGAMVAYRPTKLINTFGNYVSKKGLKQLRIAETEKYAHVTFFFNGGVEEPNKHEDRILVNSPKVATYDLQPEMSLPEVKAELIKAIHSGEYDTFVCNIANPDMIGHTGVEEACIKAAEVVDTSLGEILQAIKEANGEVIVTADHGNMELLFDEETQKPVTSHTTFPVPLVYFGERQCTLKDDGALCDVSPTLLHMMGLGQPEEMTGHSLIAFEDE